MMRRMRNVTITLGPLDGVETAVIDMFSGSRILSASMRGDKLILHIQDDAEPNILVNHRIMVIKDYTICELIRYDLPVGAAFVATVDPDEYYEFVHVFHLGPVFQEPE